MKDKNQNFEDTMRDDIRKAMNDGEYENILSEVVSKQMAKGKISEHGDFKDSDSFRNALSTFLDDFMKGQAEPAVMGADGKEVDSYLSYFTLTCQSCVYPETSSQSENEISDKSYQGT